MRTRYSQEGSAWRDAAHARLKEAYVLDVMVPYTEHVLPMIPSGQTYKDVIYKGFKKLQAGSGL